MEQKEKHQTMKVAIGIALILTVCFVLTCHFFGSNYENNNAEELNQEIRLHPLDHNVHCGDDTCSIGETAAMCTADCKNSIN